MRRHRLHLYSNRLRFPIVAVSLIVSVGCIPYTKIIREPTGKPMTKASMDAAQWAGWAGDVTAANGVLSIQIEEKWTTIEETVQLYHQRSQPRFWSPLYIPVGLVMGAVWLGVGIPCAVCTEYKLYHMFKAERVKGVTLHMLGIAARWHLFDIDMDNGWEEEAVEEKEPTGRTLTMLRPHQGKVDVLVDGRVVKTVQLNKKGRARVKLTEKFTGTVTVRTHKTPAFEFTF